MTRSTVGAHTRTRWEGWDDRNVTVREAGVALAADSVPTYGTARSVPVSATASLVDVAVSPCGHAYLLDDEGRIHRYDPSRDESVALSCCWEATGSPRTLSVTRESIYVAGGKDGCVQAISRHRLQTRWIASAGVKSPITLATSGDEVYLLDGGGGERAGGFVSHVGRRGHIEPVVTGLLAPRDLATGGETLVVLEAVAGDDASSVMEPVLRRFDVAELVPGSPVDATDTIWIAPGGFGLPDHDGVVPPRCVALGLAGDVLVGVEPAWDGPRALLRFRQTAAIFERQPGFEQGCVALAAADRPAHEPTVYAVDGRDGRLHVVRGTRRLRRHADTGDYRGTVVTRFDAGEPGTRWDRIELDHARPGSETAVGVRYAATDHDRPLPPSADEVDALGVETIHGIGPTYAARFREAGIETVASLAALSPVAARTIVSVEEFDVSVETVAGWIEDAHELLAGGADDLAAIHGVGPTYAARLRAAGIDDLERLIGHEPATVARLVSASRLDVPRSRVEGWLDAARKLRPDRRPYDGIDWTAVTPDSPRETLLDGATGRYLWVEIELLGTADASPTVRSFRATFPRESTLEYLPAIYREDRASAAFLERYLSLFESVFDDVEAGIGALARFMDPRGIPGTPDHLAWLGDWLAVAVDDAWPEGAARAFIARAPELYRMRGTRRGLLAAIECYLDHVEVPRPSWERAAEQEAARLEALVAAGSLTAAEGERAERAHAALAATGPEPLVTVLEPGEVASVADAAARVPFERLLGSRRSFLVLVHPAVADADVRAIARLVERHQPAHALGLTVGLERRTQLTGESPGRRGYHTYLGVNSVLADGRFALDDADLGRDTVLAGHEPDGQFDLQARLGEDARLS